MLFTVIKSSDYNYKDTVDINSFDQLIEWCKKTGNKVIIDTEKQELEIYNYYRE